MTDFYINEATGRRRRTHCIRGHEFTEDNIRWYADDITGTLKRRCKQCNRERIKLKYNNDPIYREAKRKYEREYRKLK